MKRWWSNCLPAALREGTGRTCLKKVAGNTGWQFADHILRMAVGLLVGVWLARYLGPESFGLLSYALAFVAMFSVFATLGLDDIIVREIVREPACRDRVLGAAFLLRLAGGLFSFLAATAAILLLRPDDSLSHWLVGIVALGGVFQSFGVIEFWFHSQVEARYTIYAKNGAFLLCSLIKVALILSEAPLTAFAWVALAEVVLGSAGLILVYGARGGGVRGWAADGDTARALFRDGWPLMLSGMVIMIYLRIDQVMLGQLGGNEEVGVYSVAVRLAEVWYFIPSAVYWSLLPGIVEAKGVSEELFYQRLQRFYNLIALCAYLVAVPVTLISHWLVPALFGEAYARGGLMLGILIWSNLFTGLEMARSSFLTAMNWTRIYLATVSLGCLLNIVLNLLLIPRYGGVGAAIASVFAYWMAAHGSCFLFKKLHKTGGMLTRALIFPRVW